jgi:hypothetical protein
MRVISRVKKGKEVGREERKRFKGFAINLIVWIGLDRKKQSAVSGGGLNWIPNLDTKIRCGGASKVGTVVSQTANQLINYSNEPQHRVLSQDGC